MRFRSRLQPAAGGNGEGRRMTDDPAWLTATEALAAFAAKRLSPVELLDSVLARAEAAQPALNAFTFTRFDEARAEARASEARWARGAPAGPLDGLPVALKDESFVEGWPTSNGSLLMKDFVAPHTSPVNARLLEAGAIVHARTATPEFSCAGYTWSRLWGVTRNPWNPEFTPGGSSGGAGAALAAGMTTLATGSDIGGSIRIPASCSGVVGYKPPYGRNPEEPPFNLDFYCHTGPMARSIGDLALMQNVMCGPHPHDIASIWPKLTLPDRFEGVEGWRIALSMDLGSFTVREDVRRNTLAAAETFRALGATVEEIEIGWGDEVQQACADYLTHLFGGHIAGMLEAGADEMTTYARAFAQGSQNSTARDFVRTLEVAGAAWMKLGPLFERFDALICPTTAIPAVPADFDQSGGRVVIEGVEVRPTLGWVMTTPFNMMSRCPVISVPTGFGTEGVPTGLQIVAPTWRDEVAFRAASAFEAAAGGWYRSAAARPRL